jgi:hypothetical protein
MAPKVANQTIATTSNGKPVVHAGRGEKAEETHDAQQRYGKVDRLDLVHSCSSRHGRKMTSAA